VSIDWLSVCRSNIFCRSVSTTHKSGCVHSLYISDAQNTIQHIMHNLQYEITGVQLSLLHTGKTENPITMTEKMEPEAYRQLYIHWCHRSYCSSPLEPLWSSNQADHCMSSSLTITIVIIINISTLLLLTLHTQLKTFLVNCYMQTVDIWTVDNSAII